MNDVLEKTEEKMVKAIDSLESKFVNVRAGRANPNMLDGVMVEYYGTPTPIKSLANISVPEARQLVIKPFDRSCLSAIEKAIVEANLGVTPNNNGEVVFIVIPALTEDRRKELVKQVKSLAEEAKIAFSTTWSENHSGENAPMYGKHLSEEACCPKREEAEFPSRFLSA